MARLKEQRAWDSLKDKLLGRVRAWRVENQITSGMADTVCINNRGTSFWMELKALDEWPKRASTKPLKDAFEKGQLPFLKEWISNGGKAYVLLKVGKEYLLLWPRLRDVCESFSWDDNLDALTREQLDIVTVRRGTAEDIITYLEILE